MQRTRIAHDGRFEKGERRLSPNDLIEIIVAAEFASSMRVPTQVRRRIADSNGKAVIERSIAFRLRSTVVRIARTIAPPFGARMRNNQPVTQQEFDFPDDATLMSTT
ncbi:hypothetical protein KGP93_34315, partial [Burkholderia multivorans]|nr:hypothetical protein [Burkholderia multivorans]